MLWRGRGVITRGAGDRPVRVRAEIDRTSRHVSGFEVRRTLGEERGPEGAQTAAIIDRQRDRRRPNEEREGGNESDTEDATEATHVISSLPALKTTTVLGGVGGAPSHPQRSLLRRATEAFRASSTYPTRHIKVAEAASRPIYMPLSRMRRVRVSRRGSQPIALDIGVMGLYLVSVALSELQRRGHSRGRFPRS